MKTTPRDGFLIMSTLRSGLRAGMVRCEQAIRMVEVRTLAIGMFLLTALAAFAAPAKAMEEPQKMYLKSDELELDVDADLGQIEIRDKRTGRIWESVDASDRYGLEKVRQEDGSLVVAFHDRERSLAFTCEITLIQGGVCWEISCSDPAAPFGDLQYPPIFKTDFDEGMLLFCNRASGDYIPQRNDYPDKRLTVYGNTNTLDMPWFGMVDGRRGDGLMFLFDTPTEAAIALVRDSEGRDWPQVSWFASFNAFAYPRRVRMIFTDDGGYVRQSQVYRDWASQQGMMKTLQEKSEERPLVNWLKGAMVAWGSDGLRFAEEAYAAGVHRMIINGRYAPQEMQRMKELGYLTSEYDNYSDVREGELGLTFDNVDSVALIGEDGDVQRGWLSKDGIQYYQRSPSLALQAAKRLIPPILDEFPYTARFLDVHSALHFFEDHHPDRRMRRSDDMKHRQALYGYINELGLVTGGEHGKAWVAPYLDYTEGQLSGAFWWEMDGGHLLPFNSREEILDNFLTYGNNPATRLPLWQLAYHDSVVMTWYWGDSSGYYHNVAPEFSTRKDLFTMLYGSVPLVWLNHLGYGWDRHRERLLDTYYLTCRLHERLAFDAMTRHRCLSEDRMVQRTDFAAGGFVIVNFSGEPRDVALTETESVTLAEYGFYAAAGDLRQSRLLIDGRVKTSVAADDFYYLDAAGGAAVSVGPITSTGRIAAYKPGGKTWCVRVDRSEHTSVDLRALLPEAASVRVVERDARGRMLRELPLDGEPLQLPPAEAARTFSLLTDVAPQEVLIMPESGKLSAGQPVLLSVAEQDLEIHYTLDGSEPSPASSIYEEPLQLSQGGLLRAQTFRGSQAVGRAVDALFDVEYAFGQTDVLRGNDPPVELSFSVENIDVLAFRVDDADDGQHFDRATLGNPLLIAEDGSHTYLSELPPIAAAMDAGPIVVNPDEEGDEIRMDGRSFERGIWVHANARAAYRLNRKYKKFSVWVGVPDRDDDEPGAAESRGSVRFSFSGISEGKPGASAPALD